MDALPTQRDIQHAFEVARATGRCTAAVGSGPCGKLAPLSTGTAPRCSRCWRADRAAIACAPEAA